MFVAKLFKTAESSRSALSRSIGVTATALQNAAPQKMEKTINQVTLLGRVGNEPQLRGNEEHPVVTFSLATHNTFRYESGDLLQRTDWHRISVFKPALRDVCLKYVKKGNRLYLSGRVSYGEIRSEDGQVRTATTVIVDDIIFLQSKNPIDVADEAIEQA